MSDAKPVSASRITLSQLMQPEYANLRGAVHGGWIMKLADEAGGLAAIRHAQTGAVTVAIDQMSFHLPIRIGDLVILQAELTYVGNSSMETRVEVTAENPLTGERVHTNTAYLVYVALDSDGRPARVPRLIAETETERRRMVQGERRQTARLKRAQAEREQLDRE